MADQEAQENIVEETEETSEETQETSESTETTGENPEAKEDEAKLDKRITEALQLLDALEDPKTARLVIENLAKQAGLIEGSSKKEQQKAVRDIKSIIKEKLGPDNDWLSDKLGDAISEALDVKISEVKGEITAKEAKQAEANFTKEYNEVISREKVTETEAAVLMDLIDEMPWNGKTSLDKYLTRLISYHRSEVAKTKLEGDKKRRQEQNIKSQTGHVGAESNEDRINKGSVKPSAREAVLAAMRGEKLN